MRISDWSSDVCSSNLRRELGVEDALAEIEGLTEPMLVVLGKAGIKTLDDLADLSTDELIARKRSGERRRGKETAPDDEAARGGEIGRASCRERVCQYV